MWGPWVQITADDKGEELSDMLLGATVARTTTSAAAKNFFKKIVTSPCQPGPKGHCVSSTALFASGEVPGQGPRATGENFRFKKSYLELESFALCSCRLFLTGGFPAEAGQPPVRDARIGACTERGVGMDDFLDPILTFNG